MTTGLSRASLVGRAAEVEAVELFLHRIPGGAYALFLEGEAGIGKTRVWTEGVRVARERDSIVLRTRPAGAGAEFAFAGLADLLVDHAEAVLPQLPVPQRRALAAALLLEEHADVAVDRHAVAAALLGTLRMLARDRPVVLAVDDAQWLDSATTDVLAFALRRVDPEPVGLLGTVRLSPESHADKLVAALPDHRVSRLALRPLTVAALYEIVQERFGLNLSRATLLRLHETSDGNPFYALEIARLLAATGAEPSPGGPLPVPKDLREVVRARLSGLSPEAYEVLLGAAALARPTVIVLDRAFEDADAALAEAASASVVEIDGDDVRFSHPLLASIHYEGAPRRAREAVHRRLAMVVADREERARHRALALDEPNERVAEQLEEAARAAGRRGAPTAAAELAELSLARTDPRSRGRHDRTLLAADFHFAIGRPARARALLDDALSTTQDANERAELLLKAAVVATEGESAEAAIELAHEGLAVATDDRLRARLLSHLALFGYVDGYDRSVAYGREAIEHAERSGDPSVLAECLATHAWRSYVNTGIVLFDALDRAAELERAGGHVAVDSGAVEARAQVLSDAGYFDRAREVYEELLAIARARGDVLMTYPLAELACIDYEEGRFDSAAERAKEAAEIAAQGGRLAAEGTALFRLAGAEAARGNVDEAIELCERSAHLLDVSGLPLRGARLMRGKLELSLENYEAAWQYLDWSQPRNGTEGMGRPRAQVPEAIEALVGLGRLDEAREFLLPFETRARELDRAWAMGWAAKCRGLIAAAEGDLEAAEAALLEAVELEHRAGRPYERARSLLALGEVQRRRRKKQAARATLREALDTFEHVGARIWAARADAELRRIGGRSAPAGGELSATEQRIVELATAGRTNREIAEAMYVSPKTVEWNLSKIYRKLGVRSRTELVVRG